MRLLSATIGAMLTTTGLLFSAQPDTINWYSSDLRPLFIVDGPFTGQGNLELTVEKIRKLLPQYVHLTVWASYQKAWLDIGAGKKAIRPGSLITPEREKIAQFGKVAHGILLSQQVIAPKSNEAIFQPYLDKEGAIDLPALLKEGKVNGIFTADRSYTPYIDSLIAAYRATSSVKMRTPSGDQTYGTMMMVNLGRADFTIGYESEYAYEAQIQGFTTPMNYYTIKGMPSAVQAWVAAPKNEWGSKVLHDIDSVTLIARNTPEYFNYLSRWMAPSQYPLLKKNLKSAKW